MPPPLPEPKHELILKSLAGRVKQKRLDLNMTQDALALAADVPLPTYRKFERTGIISLQGFVKIGLALGAEKEFDALLKPSARKRKEAPAKRLRARKGGA